jgi:predicted nucleic acid-binding protein
VRFWDSSAIVPLLLAEEASADVEALLRGDRETIVWWSTRTECLSALHRRLRDGRLERRDLEIGRNRLLLFEKDSIVVQPGDPIRDKAERLLAIHLLRAADAFQLAAALAASEEHTVDLPFVTLDDRLAEAAGREGFAVLPR